MSYSIIIPTCDNINMLAGCLQALCEQSSYEAIAEIIIINDGEDDIKGVIASFQGRLDIISLSSGPYVGPATARNRGLREAKGDVIVFIDDDSIPEKDWFEKISMSWEENPHAAGIGGYISIFPGASFLYKVNAGFYNWYFDECSRMGYTDFISTCNCSYRKKYLDRTGWFDEKFSKASGEDRELSYRVSSAGGILMSTRGARVRHDIDITFKDFLRKHLKFGESLYILYRYHHLKRSVGVGSYIRLFVGFPATFSSMVERGACLVLITISQVFTVLGVLKTVLFPGIYEKGQGR